MKRCMMVLLVVGLYSLPIQAFAKQSETVQLTLDQAVELALEHNETYLSAQMNATRARSQKREAIAEALPRLTLNSIYTRNWSLPELNFGGQTFRVGTDNTMNMSLDFSQPIYSGGKLGAGLKLAKYFEEQSDVNREQARQDIVLTIHQAYYSVLLAQSIHRVNEASYDRAVAQLNQVEKFHAAGTVSPYDVLRAKVQVANSKPPVIQTKNRLAVSKAQLKSLIGIPQTTSLVISGNLAVVTPPPATLQEAIQRAATSRPAIIAAQLQTNMMDRSIAVSRSEGRPEVSLSAGYQLQAQVDDGQVNSFRFGDFVRSWNTRLNISIPIFDGRQTSSRVGQAQADYELALYNESLVKKQIEVDVTEAFLNVQEAVERIAAEQEAIDLAERGLAIAQVQYENGMSTQLEVIDAQLAVTQAQTNHVTAQHDYAVAIVTLQNAQGVLAVP